MLRPTILSLLSLLTVVSSSPTPPQVGNDTPIAERADCSKLPPSFVLAGDSTTAQGGGWGSSFIASLKGKAKGVNHAKNGATTVSFVEDKKWDDVMASVKADVKNYNVIVTIQFGHNDQKEKANISLRQFETNLINLGNQVKAAGATPLFVTSLTRRVFDSEHSVKESLADQRLAAIAAAQKTSSPYIDLNHASRDYVNAIGEKAAQKYNLATTDGKKDTTHLNSLGGLLFGRMVADLVLGHKPVIASNDNWAPSKSSCYFDYFTPNATLSHQIWTGTPV